MKSAVNMQIAMWLLTLMGVTRIIQASMTAYESIFCMAEFKFRSMKDAFYLWFKHGKLSSKVMS